MPPWRYLRLKISKRLAIKNNPKTLADLHQLCVSLNCVKPWLGITTKDLGPHFNLLKQGEEPSSPRILTQEVRQALEKVQELMSSRRAHRCPSDLLIMFIILGRLPHLHGMIFQWNEGKKKDKDQRDPLLIVDWGFLSHHLSKRSQCHKT